MRPLRQGSVPSRLVTPWLILPFVIASLAGAAVIHLIEFHLGLGAGGPGAATASSIAYMLSHCPLSGPVLGALLAALALVCVALIALRLEMARLRGLDRRLHERRAPVLRAPLPRLESSPWRTVAALSILLTASQVVVFTIALRAVPMDYMMAMHGGHMLMAVTPPVPVLPLALVLATSASALLVLFERRLHAIQELILDRLAILFGLAEQSPVPDPLAVLGPVSRRFGPNLFSRPPPAHFSFLSVA